MTYLTRDSSFTPGIVLRKSTVVGDETSTTTTDGVVTQTGGDSTMEFNGSGGLFTLSNGNTFFHSNHSWTPDGGDSTYDRIDTIWVAEGAPPVPDDQSDPGNGYVTGAGYEYNTGNPDPSPVPAPPYSTWYGYVLIAEVLVPANATNANACTITDMRVFI